MSQNSNNEKIIHDLVQESLNVISNSLADSSKIINVANEISSRISSGNKVIIFGNGGSAADAQHIAGELVGRFLKNRKREFVEAARSLGASQWSILFKHILPNSLTPIITFTPFVIAGSIAGLASLDYLGFGLEVPTPSWGELLAQAQKNYTIAPWLAIYPSICLFSTLTLLNLIGEGVRDAMDPNLT